MIVDGINIIEEDIESYMKQFKTNRETTIAEIVVLMKDYYIEQEKSMQDTYDSILRSRY